MFESVKAHEISDVDVLLHSSVNVNARDDKGWTPLMHAAQCRDNEIYNLLWNSGADPLLQNEDGGTAEEMLKSNNVS